MNLPVDCLEIFRQSPPPWVIEAAPQLRFVVLRAPVNEAVHSYDIFWFFVYIAHISFLSDSFPLLVTENAQLYSRSDNVLIPPPSPSQYLRTLHTDKLC